MTIPQTVVDTIFKALAPACPERVIAGHHADLASGGAYGYIDPETGRILAGVYGCAGLAGGGWGAKRGADGMNATVCINEGDGYAVETGGGGGFGDPLERPAEQVLRDVMSGYVSVEAARRDYGVVIHALGRHFALDIEATEELRREMAGKNESGGCG